VGQDSSDVRRTGYPVSQEMRQENGSPSDRGLAVARALADWLRKRFGDRVLQVTLFGSVARGEAAEDSDVDLLVLVREPLTRGEQAEMSDYSYDLDLAHGTVTQYFVETVDRWERPAIRTSLLGRTVESEGVPL